MTEFSSNLFGLNECSYALVAFYKYCATAAAAVFNENYKLKNLRQTFPIYYKL